MPRKNVQLFGLLLKSLPLDTVDNEIFQKHDRMLGYADYIGSVTYAASRVLPKRLPMPKVCLWDTDPEVEQARHQLTAAYQKNSNSNYGQLKSKFENTYK